MPSCKLCPSLLDLLNEDELEAHIAADHFLCLPYECESCRFAKFPTEYAVRAHYEQVHGMTEYYVRYRMSPEILVKREQARQAFKAHIEPNEAGSVSTTKTSVRNGQAARSANKSRATPTSRNPLVMSGATEGATNESRTTSSPSTERSTSTSANPAQLVGHPAAASSLKMEFYEAAEECYVADLEPTSAMDEEESAASSAFMETPVASKLYPVPGASRPCVQLLPGSSGASSTSVADAFDGRAIFAANRSSKSRAPRTKEEVGKRECVECKELVSNYSTSLVFHVNLKHLRFPMHRCMLCDKPYMSLSKRDAVSHAKSAHGGDESMIEDNRKEYISALNKAVPIFFPGESQPRFQSDET